MEKQPLSQAAIDLGLGLTDAKFRNFKFAVQVKTLFARADFEGLARDLQRLLILQVQDSPAAKRRAALDRATKIIFEASGSAWAKRIAKGLLTRLPRGEERRPARGAPPTNRLMDAQWVTTWNIWRTQNPNSSVRQFIEWDRYTFQKLPRPSRPDKLHAEITSARSRFERARKRYSLAR